MTSATFSNPTMPQPVVRLRVGRIFLVLVLLLGLVALGSYWMLATYGKKVVTPPVETSTHPAWMKQPVAYAAAEPTTVKPAVDPNTALLRELQMQNQQLATDLRAQKEALEALRKRPAGATTTSTPPPQKVAPAPKETPKKATAGPMLFVSNTVESPERAGPQAHEYTLAPTTFLPCLVETRTNSDVEGVLVCLVMTNVFDTATGQHLLVPQGSRVLGHTQSNQLIYGNERMNTISLKLAFPDGRSVDLHNAPITDQQGIAGLTQRVDHHYGRLLAAVLIQGVLKAGTASLTIAATDAAGAGQVTSGLTGLANQAGTKVTGPMVNTRPTIEVDTGAICNIILLEALHLPAVWDGSSVRR